MQAVSAQDIILIDIETAPICASFESLDLKWQELWIEKTGRYKPAEISTGEYFNQRAGVMAEFAKIICISIGYFRNETSPGLRIKSFYGEDELQLLNEFLDTLQKIEDYQPGWSFAGHNIKEFDIPFICRRILINRLSLPAYLDFHNKKPWETNLLDTFQYWRFGDYKNYTSLNLLASVLDVPTSKDDIDGSQVGKLFWEPEPKLKKENLARIVAYCQKDVIATGNIFLRFCNLPLLSVQDISILG